MSGEDVALGMYNKAISQFELSDAKHPGYATMCCAQGVEKYNLGLYNEAQVLYEKVLNTCGSELGCIHPDVAVALHGLGKLYSDQHEYTLSEDHYLRALVILEKVENADTAALWTDLAGLRLSQNRLDDAEALLMRSLPIQMEILGPMHPDIAKTLCVCGQYFQRMSTYDVAEQLINRALEIFEICLPAGHLDICQTMRCKGELHYIQNKYHEAKLVFQKLRLIWSISHPKYCGILRYLALIHQRLDIPAAVEKLKTDLLELLEDNKGAYGCKDRRTDWVVIALLPIYIGQGDINDLIKRVVSDRTINTTLLTEISKYENSHESNDISWLRNLLDIDLEMSTQLRVNIYHADAHSTNVQRNVVQVLCEEVSMYEIDVGTREVLAKLCFKMQLYNEALGLYLKLQTSASNYTPEKMEVYVKLEQYQQAIYVYNEFKPPPTSELFDLLANCYQKLSDAVLPSISELPSTCISEQVKVHVDSGEYQLAIDVYNETKPTPTSELLGRLATCYKMLRDAARAERSKNRKKGAKSYRRFEEYVRGLKDESGMPIINITDILKHCKN